MGVAAIGAALLTSGAWATRGSFDLSKICGYLQHVLHS